MSRVWNVKLKIFYWMVITFIFVTAVDSFFVAFLMVESLLLVLLFYPKTIRFNQQLNALRQNWYKLQELKIMKHHEYKFSKNDYDEVIDYSSDRKDVKPSPNPENNLLEYYDTVFKRKEKKTK